MANLITVLRLLLLFGFVVWVYRAPMTWQLVNPLWIALIFVLDAVDGYVARARGESSLLGAVLDIAADRVIENVLWLVLVDLQRVPLWVAVVFLTRGILIDSLRGVHHRAPFDLMRSSVGRFLVKGRTLRFGYAFVKFLAFGWWFTLIPLARVWPEFWQVQQGWLLGIADMLVYLAVMLCLLRGLPVLVELLGSQRWNHGASSHGPGVR